MDMIECRNPVCRVVIGVKSTDSLWCGRCRKKIAKFRQTARISKSNSAYAIDQLKRMGVDEESAWATRAHLKLYTSIQNLNTKQAGGS